MSFTRGTVSESWMTVLPVIYSIRARRNVDSIQRYIAEKSSARIAENYVERIRNVCDAIGVAPFQGECYLGKRYAAFRKIGFEGNATIVFTILDDRVLIVAIQRKGRDVQRHL
jgi:plasmid stabilization system protein ParE